MLAAFDAGRLTSDILDLKGNVDGLRKEGLDPIALEASFPGLVPESVVASSMPSGQIMGAVDVNG